MKILGPTSTSTTRRRSRLRSLATLGVLLLVVGAGCSAVVVNEPGTRYGTAALLAEEAFPDGAEVALLATGRNFADALAAAPLSDRLDGPILLTARDRVPEETMGALEELDVTEVVLLGGPAAISEDVEETLSEEYQVSRRAGDDRFETAASLAEEAFPDGADVALLATGENFADALAAAPLSASVDGPILLTARDRVPEETMAVLDDLGVREVVLLGGTAAITQRVRALLSVDHEVSRRAGADRFETAALLAEEAFPGGAEVALLATGEDFPDALAAAPLSAFHDGPILLTDRDRVPPSTSAALEELGVSEVILLGGTAAISDGVEDLLEEGDYDVSRHAR